MNTTFQIIDFRYYLKIEGLPHVSRGKRRSFATLPVMMRAQPDGMPT